MIYKAPTFCRHEIKYVMTMMMMDGQTDGHTDR